MAGIKAGLLQASLPWLRECKPSTSLCGAIESSTVCLQIGGGKGNCTKIPSTAVSLLSAKITFINFSLPLYNNLTNQKFKRQIDHDKSYFSNYTKVFHYDEEQKIISELESILNNINENKEGTRGGSMHFLSFGADYNVNEKNKLYYTSFFSSRNRLMGEQIDYEEQNILMQYKLN